MNNTKLQTNNLFLIGAGFTKAVFPSAPLNVDLLRCLVEDNPETPLRKYLIRYRTDDIEILLTRMDLEIVELQSERLRKEREIINTQIAAYFGQFRFRKEKAEESPWLESLAKELIVEDDAIVTLNYDCVLEGLLDYYKVWSPAQGYAGIENPLLDSPANPNNIRIFKLHGSEHFIESPGWPDKNKTAIGFPIDESIYPHSGKNTCFGYGMGDTGSRPYIIPPGFVKVPHQDIELIMIKALEAAASANNFIIVGCSLRLEDSFLWLLLTSFLNQPVNSRKLVIADPCAEKLAEKMVGHYFVDINRFIRIKTLPKKLEDSAEELSRELHETST